MTEETETYSSGRRESERVKKNKQGGGGEGKPATTADKTEPAKCGTSKAERQNVVGG